MKLTSTITAVTALGLTLLTASVAFAQSNTREQVLAELQRARASGEISAMQSENTASFNPGLIQTGAKSGKTRAEVLAELRRARTNGELDGIDGESNGFSHLARIDLPGRAQVLVGQGAASGN